MASSIREVATSCDSGARARRRSASLRSIGATLSCCLRVRTAPRASSGDRSDSGEDARSSVLRGMTLISFQFALTRNTALSAAEATAAQEAVGILERILKQNSF